ncbi:unnamed protein product [Mytilus edulis]|uniref:Uncharacterized protein n=1 Tax=Mytilus edulis TaxID=6550 RepID=A0A8S3SEJ6_MYTED|nr:unnamed protein product [Mytilus edulis]
MRHSLFFLAVLPCVFGIFGKKCVVDPIENRWPDMGKICHDPLEYNHIAIEQAIIDDPEIQMYLQDASKIYQPAVPYDDPHICPLDIGNPSGPQIVECGSICPSSYTNLTTVWFEYEPGRTTMCNVMRPWQQIVYYMQCGTKYPLVDGMDNSFQCVPEDLIRRKIAVYCPNIVPQCRKMDIDLPQHCAASKFQCRQKKVSQQSKLDNLFASFGTTRNTGGGGIIYSDNPLLAANRHVRFAQGVRSSTVNWKVTRGDTVQSQSGRWSVAPREHSSTRTKKTRSSRSPYNWLITSGNSQATATTEAMSKKRHRPKTFSPLVIETVHSSSGRWSVGSPEQPLRRPPSTPFNWLVRSSQESPQNTESLPDIGQQSLNTDSLPDIDMSPITQDIQEATDVDMSPITQDTQEATDVEQPYASSRRTTPKNWLLASTLKPSNSQAYTSEELYRPWSTSKASTSQTYTSKDPVDMSQMTPSTQDRQKATVVDNTPYEWETDTDLDIHSVEEGHRHTDVGKSMTLLFSMNCRTPSDKLFTYAIAVIPCICQEGVITLLYVYNHSFTHPSLNCRLTHFNTILDSCKSSVVANDNGSPLFLCICINHQQVNDNTNIFLIADNTPPEEQPAEIGEGHRPTVVDIHSVDEGQMGTDVGKSMTLLFSMNCRTPSYKLFTYAIPVIPCICQEGVITSLYVYNHSFTHPSRNCRLTHFNTIVDSCKSSVVANDNGSPLFLCICINHQQVNDNTNIFLIADNTPPEEQQDQIGEGHRPTVVAEPPHIIERPDSEQGQKLSWQLERKTTKRQTK